MITRSKNFIDRKKLHSATGLVNYIRSDCIIDYLDQIKRNDYEIDFENELKIRKRKFTKLNDEKITNTNFLKKRKTSFDYIVEDGYKFENNIFTEIKNKLKNDNQLEILIEINEEDISKKYNMTKEIIIQKKYDIILGGVLVNQTNNTYGYPDIIVSGFWIKKYIKDTLIEIPNDRSIYYIIDVKSSSISLVSGGESMSSGLLYDGYKAQIYVYKEALNNITGSNNNIAFILGKKYEYYSGGKKIKIDDPFSRLAIVNFENEKKNGKDFKEKIDKALEWKNDLNKNWKKYSLYPIEKDELYPNMKNSYDKNYRPIKKKIAIKNKELTLLWNCGVKNRKLAFQKGIKTYDDEKINPESLGYETKSKKYKIIDLMLKINKKSNDKIINIDNTNNYLEWRNKVDYEFFVDFETYSKEEIYGENLDEDFIENLNNQVIYMIGVYHKEKFKCFIINYNNIDTNSLDSIKKNIEKIKNLKCSYDDYVFCLNEKDLIERFTNYIVEFSKSKNKTRLIHWSSAEPIMFNKKIKEYGLFDDKYNLPWYDLLSVFKYDESPIIIKECFGFGLKEIVKKLNDHKLIKLVWPELDDGLLSSFVAKNIYKNKIEIQEKNKNMIEIVEYNYIDCLAISILLDFIRNY